VAEEGGRRERRLARSRQGCRVKIVKMVLTK